MHKIFIVISIYFKPRTIVFSFGHDFIGILDIWYDNFRILNVVRIIKMLSKIN